jgi:hypothetical protein
VLLQQADRETQQDAERRKDNHTCEQFFQIVKGTRLKNIGANLSASSIFRA